MFFIEAFEKDDYEIYLGYVESMKLSEFEKEMRYFPWWHKVDLELIFEFKNFLKFVSNRMIFFDEKVNESEYTNFSELYINDTVLRKEIEMFFIFIVSYWDKIVVLEQVINDTWDEKKRREYSIKYSESKLVAHINSIAHLKNKIDKYYDIRNYLTHNFSNWNFINVDSSRISGMFAYREYWEKSKKRIELSDLHKVILTTMYLFFKIFSTKNR